MIAAKMPLTKQLNVAIIDSNPALQSGQSIKKEDPPDPRVSTVTPATISLFKGITSHIVSFWDISLFIFEAVLYLHCCLKHLSEAWFKLYTGF